MTTPGKKQDGTIELDVGQIDLLDLPLPPSSSPAVDEARMSKGPPPLPPLPPGDAQASTTAPPPDAAAPAPGDEPKETPVPSLPPPPAPVAPGVPAVSARKLVDGPSESGSPFVKFLLGMGAAAIVCGGAFFAYRATHKSPPPAPVPSAAPTQAFTMAPIEFTEPVGSEAPSASAPPAPSASAPPSTASGHATSAPPHSGHATTGGGAAKPTGHPDDVIKVEN